MTGHTFELEPSFCACVCQSRLFPFFHVHTPAAMTQAIRCAACSSSGVTMSARPSARSAKAAPVHSFTFRSLVAPTTRRTSQLGVQRRKSIPALCAVVTPGGKLISKVEVPAFIPRDDFADQMVRWLYMEQTDAAQTFGMPIKVPLSAGACIVGFMLPLPRAAALRCGVQLPCMLAAT